LPEGKVCQHPVNSPDLVTLFCDVAGVKLPWKTPGRDMRPLLTNPETAEWNTPTLLTHTGRTYGSDTNIIPTDEALTAAGNTPWWVLLRDGKYKYIRTLVEGETEEIYDLQSDPEELTNLAARPQHQELLKSLRAKAVAELKRTGAGFVDNMPRTKAMMAGG
jgi:arylsulfatase A-like enzyme